MSLVEVQPSTVIELNESRTAMRSRSARGPGSTAASVVRKASMVAMSGASMPAPLAMPATVKPSGARRAPPCGPESVVRMPVAASSAAWAEPDRAATSAGIPSSIGLHRAAGCRSARSSTPAPVGPGRSRPLRRPARTSDAASARPGAPVAALAFPLLTTTAGRPAAGGGQVGPADLHRGGRGPVGGEGGGGGHRPAVVGGHQGQVQGAGGLDARRPARRPRTPRAW